MSHRTNTFYRNIQIGRAFETAERAGWIALPDGVAAFEVPTNLRGKRGRIDIRVDELGEFVSIIELKATNWDEMKPNRIRPNLYRHQNQIWRYIEHEIIDDKRDVCPAIIYEHAPRTPGLRQTIEEYLNEFGIQVVWRHE